MSPWQGSQTLGQSWPHRRKSSESPAGWQRWGRGWLCRGLATPIGPGWSSRGPSGVLGGFLAGRPWVRFQTSPQGSWVGWGTYPPPGPKAKPWLPGAECGRQTVLSPPSRHRGTRSAWAGWAVTEPPLPLSAPPPPLAQAAGPVPSPGHGAPLAPWVPGRGLDPPSCERPRPR